MNPVTLEAFYDELTKISSAPTPKDRFREGLKGVVIGGSAFIGGMGAGELAMKKVPGRLKFPAAVAALFGGTLAGARLGMAATGVGPNG